MILLLTVVSIVQLVSIPGKPQSPAGARGQRRAAVWSEPCLISELEAPGGYFLVLYVSATSVFPSPEEPAVTMTVRRLAVSSAVTTPPLELPESPEKVEVILKPALFSASW
jgi:hypothetical protein